jgi:GNAT superfamily N-acetyltransferase
VPAEVERDGADARALHAVLVDGAGVVVATGRLLDAGDHGRVGRVAVDPAARGTGAGTAVMTALERASGALGLIRVRLHAQQPVVGFYLRLGYAAVGSPDSEAGLAHQWMERELLPGLREVADSDSAAIIDLIGGCFAEYPGCVLDLAGLDDWMRAPATARAGSGARQWVVPGVGGALAACIGLAPDGERGAEVKALYVRREARRRGFGAALVGWAERAARQDGREWVSLWSDTRFADAHRLYTRLGYRRLAGHRDLHDPSHTREWPFRKELSGGRARIGDGTTPS